MVWLRVTAMTVAAALAGGGVIANAGGAQAQQTYAYGGSPIMPIAATAPPSVTVPPALAGGPVAAPGWSGGGRAVTFVTYPAMAAPAAPVGYATQAQSVPAAAIIASVPRGYYTIVKGGRLADVARRTGTRAEDLRRLNPGLAPDLTLPPGTVVALPKAWNP